MSKILDDVQSEADEERRAVAQQKRQFQNEQQTLRVALEKWHDNALQKNRHKDKNIEALKKVRQ